MEAFWQLQIPFIQAVQQIDWLALPMQLLSFLGSAEFSFLVLPVLYWCIDAALGIRVAFILLVGTGLNGVAKLAFHGPRPYWVSTQVKALASDPAFGLPSAHAQNAVALWGTLAAKVRSAWSWLAAVFLMLGIGFSRIFAGVHFLHDVAIGWLFGLIILWAFWAFWEPIHKWVRRLPMSRQIMLSFAIPLALLALGALLEYALRGFVVPEEWAANAMHAGIPLVPPVSMDYMVTSGGVLLGFSIGLVLINQAGGFAPAKTLGKRLLTLVVGVIGVATLYVGLRRILPGGSSALGAALDFIRYAITGFWIAAGAPYVFRQLKLLE